MKICQGSKLLTNPFNLLPGVCGTETAAEERPPARCGGRQDYVDIDAALQQAVPHGECLFHVSVVHGNNRTGGGSNFVTESFDSFIQEIGIVPQPFSQFRL